MDCQIDFSEGALANNFADFVEFRLGVIGLISNVHQYLIVDLSLGVIIINMWNLNLAAVGQS
jgi:hypothetical protein